MLLLSSAVCGTCFILVFCLAYFLILKMRATSADLQWTTQPYIPEDRTLNKSCMVANFMRNLLPPCYKDGDSCFLQNVGNHLHDCVVL
jgi:hypothetical protein